MLKQVYEINEFGYLKDKYVKDFDEEGNCVEELEENIIVIDPPQGLYKAKWNGEEWVEDMSQEEIDLLNNPVIPFEIQKDSKWKEVNQTCTDIIYSGIDVETSLGVEHFSLQQFDQMEIKTLADRIMIGALQVPYHADGKLCRMFTAEEMTAIATKSIEYVTYHKTYVNSLHQWIKRCETEEELNAIEYGVPLPIDLDENLVMITGVSSIPVEVPVDKEVPTESETIPEEPVDEEQIVTP